ncbi:polysialic acid transporter [Aquitalea sp. FJL05]|uniref:ABC transporter permease n=1 Tax=Aquitalea TaxID=407217 RepID=UPI000F596902|nr:MULTISPECIES: ABC transporter permease [Aquitalea]RQO72817.1 polysialic acid transporter [Aquitalea sp. FJL05]
MKPQLDLIRRTVLALFLREIKTRFGKYRLGYLWCLLEPLAHISILLLLFGYIMHRSIPSIPFPLFLLCGVLPFLMFNQIVSRSLNALDANQGLLSYRPVQAIDLILARTLLEGVIGTAVFLLLLLGLALAGQTIALDQLPALCGYWMLLLLFSFSLGLLFMLLGHAYPESEKLIPLLLKPLYFLSGVMFPLALVPARYQTYLLWNPLAHALELIRHALVASYPADHVHGSYLLLWTLGLLFFSLLLYKGRANALRRS